MSISMKKQITDGKAGDMIGADNVAVELKSRCVPLIFDCPRKVDIEGCPFGEIRKNDVVDRVKWIKAKTVQELRSILKHHSDCIEKGGGKHQQKG
jgi:hypothetical protein